MKITVPLAAFVLTELLCAFIVWIAGFDFDRRNFYVSLGVVLSILIGLLAANAASAWVEYCESKE